MFREILLTGRLIEPEQLKPLFYSLAKLYDGQDVEGFTNKDVRELQEETSREGMDGISPRYVINQLSRALIREGEYQRQNPESHDHL